jgi:ribosomal protein S17E
VASVEPAAEHDDTDLLDQKTLLALCQKIHRTPPFGCGFLNPCSFSSTLDTSFEKYTKCCQRTWQKAQKFLQRTALKLNKILQNHIQPYVTSIANINYFVKLLSS